ncbi:MAG: cytochrome b N-terminal domain-containing protein [Anaerolineales bacterium]|nr:cytochrome b N-terminal domain-containing protein [Anaerolineales bacterium]
MWKNIKNSTKVWFEERYQLEEVVEKNVTKKLIPKGISLFRCMGGLVLIAFLIQVGTGIFLVFYYVPSAGEASNSVQYIRHALPYGWLIQKVHAVTPYFMIVPLFAHMIRILFKGLYKDPRELHWVSGASLLVLTLVICYTGTCLPADSLAHLGAGSVGGEAAMMTDHIVGAYNDGGMASNRNLFIVYVLHIACIPIMMSVLMGFHFLMIRRTGVSEPL